VSLFLRLLLLHLFIPMTKTPTCQYSYKPEIEKLKLFVVKRFRWCPDIHITYISMTWYSYDHSSYVSIFLQKINERRNEFFGCQETINQWTILSTKLNTKTLLRLGISMTDTPESLFLRSLLLCLFIPMTKTPTYRYSYKHKIEKTKLLVVKSFNVSMSRYSYRLVGPLFLCLFIPMTNTPTCRYFYKLYSCFVGISTHRSFGHRKNET
jgi:hypothetical protein